MFAGHPYSLLEVLTVVDVVLDTPDELPELKDGQVAIEHAFTDHPETGEPFLSISARGEGLMALDAEAQDEINAAIAYHAHMAGLRATQPSHVVHVEPEYSIIRNQTFDPKRADKVEPDGEDVVEAHKVTRFDPSTGVVEILDVAEARTPYWGFDETTQSNRPIDCPDCTKGLVGDHASVGDFLRCIQAVVKPDVRPCHAGCIVACGMPRPD